MASAQINLAERVATLRRVNGLSARQLVAIVDVAPTTVIRIESGAVSPSFDLAQELLTVLGEPIGSRARQMSPQSQPRGWHVIRRCRSRW